ncbi:MAG: glucose-6-phosphate isomerase [Phycisphaerales bacterium]|nr:glucose-6-phosphate isomerase [Phycisphaerales bacterium]
MSPAVKPGAVSPLMCLCPSIGLTLDCTRMTLPPDFAATMETPLRDAFRAMRDLEAGAIANPDEKRMVGHYWLRAPNLAPSREIADQIHTTVEAIKRFATAARSGAIAPPRAPRFTDLLVIGIGGSALGPMFVADALRPAIPDSEALQPHWLDNTDPDGITRILEPLRPRLQSTLCVVISKSGSTPETRNGMLLAQAAWRAAGLEFGKHAVAITGAGSQLDRQATEEGWLARFPMWDWVGGRTSVTSAVGLLPAALMGLDIDGLLAGAAACDEVTRVPDAAANPAAMLAQMWHAAGGGRGARDMVVLPYKDRLLLFSRYLQQLIMESLGKRLDLDGRIVEQGLSVFGNKGSTDQHAYVQQLRDGSRNFFVTFIRVLEDGGDGLMVEPNVTAGDYLHGFWLGTRQALSENGRDSITLSIPRVDAFHVGVLIALYERAVGLYASLININAYHQPGVEAGKRAAAAALELQTAALGSLNSSPRTAEQIALAIGRETDVESIYWLLEHLAANGRAGREGDTFTAVQGD